MILTKTETGQQAFKGRSPLLSARQRTAFILFDGKRSVVQVLAEMVRLGLTAEDVDHMVGHGFLATAQALQPAQVAGARSPAADAIKLRSNQDRYLEAKLIATQLTAALGLRGFRLNLAVEAASGYDELLALLPEIKESVGAGACQELERTLTG